MELVSCGKSNSKKKTNAWKISNKLPQMCPPALKPDKPLLGSDIQGSLKMC